MALNLDGTGPITGVSRLTGDTSSGDLILQADPTGVEADSIIGLEVDGTERARIDSSGRFLIGNPNGRNNLFTSVPARLLVEGTGTSTTTIAAVSNRNSPNDSAVFAFGKSRGTTIGSNTIVQNNDTIGILSFHGSDGTSLKPAADIKVEIDGTPGANDMPGRLVFSTTADGSDATTERMRITSDAYVRLASGGIQFNGDTAAANALDDYEEGTWTPTIFAITGTQPTINYQQQSGFYTKIGNIVYISLIFTTNSISGGTGTSGISFTGLPFAASSAGYYNIHALNVGEALSMAGSKQLYEITASITGEVSSLATSINTNFTLSEFGTGGTANRIRMNGWYKV
jgi:hypothetical protein